MSEKSHQILKKYWGYDSFRPLQLETIMSVSSGLDTLVLMPTGGGKSIVYQLPALASEGVCVVITPLIALMKDQVDRLRSRRILAESIHSGVSARDIDRILDNCVYGDIKLLYISPERIDSDLFRTRFAKMNVSLIAVDEAHCISQWGYDFRPSYLGIARLRELQPETPILALTASATEPVCEDIMHHLKFREPKIFRMSFARRNLSYVVRNSEDKYDHLLRVINNVPGSGIVYVRTRDKSETIADMLKSKGIAADYYHGGMGYMTRGIKQDNWMQGTTRVIVATNAFGMGIDKANVRFVIHYDICDSLEAYYQEAGRAGRDGKQAYAVLLTSADDTSKAGRRMLLEFPPVETIKNIYEALFNFLQIAIGEGKDFATIFNIYEFSGRVKTFTPTVMGALKILQQNGYLILTDEMDNHTRIKFIVRRDDLYRIRVDRKELDHLITVLLRQYTGLFTDFVSISEAELAYLSGYTVEHIGELFKSLWQLHIIKYIPGCKSPMLILTEERLPINDLRISPESYTIRREVATERLNAIFHYATNTEECRSVVIQRYFGEKENAPCSECDVCRTRRLKEMPQTKKNDKEATIHQRIINQLAVMPLSIKELVANITLPSNQIVEAITTLLEQHIIAEQKDGKFRKC